MGFKEYKAEKLGELLEHDSNEFANVRFKFSESDKIQEILKYFVKDKGIDGRKIHNILQDSAVTFEDISYGDSNNASLHEDILDSGYVLGYVHAKRPGRIFAVDFEKTRYFYIGVESDIIQHLKTELNKTIKL